MTFGAKSDAQALRVVMLVLNDMTGDARVDREASTLAAAGHDVRVLCLRSPGTAPAEVRHGYRIERVADPTTAGWLSPVSKVRQLWNRSKKLISAAISRTVDVVHAHDLDTLGPSSKIAKNAGATLVFDAHELYSDMLREHGLRGSWPIQAYWRHLERTLIPASSHVITVSSALAREMHERWGVEPIVLRNVPPLVPLTRTSLLRDEHNVPADVSIILYQGVLVRGRGLSNLIASMGHVSHAVLVIQGGGAEETHLREQARSLGLEHRVLFAGWKLPETLHSYACGADIGVLSYEATTLNNRLAAPNKLWAYLMAGLPVAASDSMGMRAVIRDHSLGELFDPCDPTSIAAVLQGLLDLPEVRADMGIRARRLAESRYNWEVEEQALIDLYTDIAAERARTARLTI